MKKLSLFLIFLLILPTLSPAFNRNWAIAGGSTVVGAAVGATCYLLYKKNQSSNKPVNKVNLALSTFLGGISGLLGSHILTHLFKTKSGPGHYETDVEKARKEVEEQTRLAEAELKRKHAAEKQQLELKYKKEQDERQKAAASQEDAKERVMSPQQAKEEFKKIEKEYYEKSAKTKAEEKELNVIADRTREATHKAHEEVMELWNNPEFFNKYKSEEQRKSAFVEIYRKYGLDN